MPRDKSLPGAAPEGADIAPQAAQAEDTATKPTRRRTAASTTPRKPRSSKAATPTEVADEPVAPAPIAAEAAAPEAEAKPVKARATRTRTTKKAAAEAPPVESAPEPIAAEAEVGEPVAAKKPARGRAKKVVAETPVVQEQVPVAPIAADEPVQAPAETTEAKPRSRRTSTRRSTKKDASVTEPEAEAPVAEEVAATVETLPAEEAEAPEETPAEGASRRNRNRRSGRRGRTEEAGEVVAAKPVVVEEPVLPGVRLVVRNGRPEIRANGKLIPPILFFANPQSTRHAGKIESQVKQAAKAGVRLYSTLIELPCPLPPDDSILDGIDARIQAILGSDPTALIIPRVVFVPLPTWKEQYPNECATLLSGASDEPSLGSDKFWTEAETSLEQLIGHLQRGTYGDRLAGYHLERGEWFHPASTGYDRSYSNREAFRDWLRAKYNNSEVALQAAWYDGKVQFFTADIPQQPVLPRAGATFFHPWRERRWIDFLEFTNECVANRLIALSRAVKRASHDQALASVCYGYVFEFGHAFSGHLSLQRVLDEPSIDLICGPPSYSDRQAGHSGALPSLVDSAAVHGKLWLTEDDTKTHLAPVDLSGEDYNPRMASNDETQEVHLRAMGTALAHQTGIGWMDLWGEGWLDAADMWERIGGFAGIYRTALGAAPPASPEVVVLVDESSLFHVQRGPDYLRKLLHDHRDAFLRSGASVGFYLQSDVIAANFPTNAKLYVFLTPYRLTADQRTAIKQRLQGGGRTLAWVNAVGVCDTRGEPDEQAHDVVGLTLRQQSWDSEGGSHIVQTQHTITTEIKNRELGVRERINPTYYVEDIDRSMVVLAEYAQTGLPSLVARDAGGWKTVFCGEPTLSAELIRGLCRYAGVHLYTSNADDYTFARGHWVTLHTTTDGVRALRFPQGVAVFDLASDTLLANGATEVRISARANTTAPLFVGSLADMAVYGLSANAAQIAPTPVEAAPEPAKAPRRGRGKRGAPATEVTEAPEALEAIPEVVVDEPGDEIEEASQPEVAPRRNNRRRPAGRRGTARPADAESAAPAVASESGEGGEAAAANQGAANSEESASARRRRRRRGGRGRGRRRTDGGGDASGGSVEG